MSERSASMFHTWRQKKKLTFWHQTTSWCVHDGHQINPVFLLSSTLCAFRNEHRRCSYLHEQRGQYFRTCSRLNKNNNEREFGESKAPVFCRRLNINSSVSSFLVPFTLLENQNFQIQIFLRENGFQNCLFSTWILIISAVIQRLHTDISRCIFMLWTTSLVVSNTSHTHHSEYRGRRGANE